MLFFGCDVVKSQFKPKVIKSPWRADFPIFDTEDDDWIKEHAESLYKTHAGSGPDYTELRETIDCTKEMYDYFLEKNIKVRILSNSNPADKRFERITLDEL